jgi:hypothetical protein
LGIKETLEKSILPIEIATSHFRRESQTQEDLFAGPFMIQTEQKALFNGGSGIVISLITQSSRAFEIKLVSSGLQR